MSTPTLSYRALLDERDVRALLLATVLLRLAARMFALTIVLYGVTRLGSPVLAGWLAFATIAPGLAISPIAGALIDRVGSVWAISVDITASAICVAALIAIDRLDFANAPLLLVLTGLYSLTSPLSIAGVRTLLPRLVPLHARDRANALDTAINGLSDIVGPALAGALIGFAGPTVALGTIAVTYGAAAFSVARIRRPRGQMPRLGPLLAQAWTGVARVVQQPTLRGLAAAYSLYEIAWGVLVVVVPVFAAQQFGSDQGAAIAGLLWAGLGLVGGTAALIAGHVRTLGRERRVMAIGMLVTALAAWPVAGELGLVGLVAGLMLVGAAAGPIDVGVLTLRQRRTDPAELGRVLSVSISLNMAGGPIGSALGGMLVGWSIAGTLAVAAFAAMLGASAVALIPRVSEYAGGEAG